MSIGCEFMKTLFFLIRFSKHKNYYNDNLLISTWNYFCSQSYKVDSSTLNIHIDPNCDILKSIFTRIYKYKLLKRVPYFRDKLL